MHGLPENGSWTCLRCRGAAKERGSSVCCREPRGRFLTCEEEVAVEWDRVEVWVEAAGEEDRLPRVPVVIACVRSVGKRNRMRLEYRAQKNSAPNAVQPWSGNNKGKETQTCQEEIEQAHWALDREQDGEEASAPDPARRDLTMEVAGADSEEVSASDVFGERRLSRRLMRHQL
jgi:hypothetical protein